MYEPVKRTRTRPNPSVAIACVILGFLIGGLFLSILGRYGVPWWVGGITYLLAVVSAFLTWAGFMRGE